MNTYTDAHEYAVAIERIGGHDAIVGGKKMLTMPIDTGALYIFDAVGPKAGPFVAKGGRGYNVHDLAHNARTIEAVKRTAAMRTTTQEATR